ncbi:retrovirus-related pol polyprotein from transposon TNT 1-94 [Tanacetum coccineum]
MTSIAKFDVKKFDGSNDFGLWRVKMRCLLIQHGWEAALDPFLRTMTDADKTAALKTNVYKKEHSALLFCLDNKVLKEVNKEDSAAGFVIGDLANIDVDIERRFRQAYFLRITSYIITLCWRHCFMDERSRTLEDVLSSSLRELNKEDRCQGLLDHLKKDYPKRNKKKSTSFVKKNAGQGSGMHSEGYDNGDLLMAVSEERNYEAKLCVLLRWLGNKGLGKLEFCENYVLGKSTRVHFLRHKNEAFIKFKEWKQLVENQTGRKLKKLQTDNSLEFCNQEFMKLVQGERDSKTFDSCRNSSGLPDSLWAEATVTTSYLINRSPSTALEKMTPMDLWSGHLANYDMLRIFGCVAYSYLCIRGNSKPRGVGFNESLMYKDTLKGAGAVDSGKEVEFEVELQRSRVEPTVDPHTEENLGNEDEEQDERHQQ